MADRVVAEPAFDAQLEPFSTAMGRGRHRTRGDGRTGHLVLWDAAAVALAAVIVGSRRSADLARWRQTRGTDQQVF